VVEGEEEVEVEVELDEDVEEDVVVVVVVVWLTGWAVVWLTGGGFGADGVLPRNAATESPKLEFNSDADASHSITPPKLELYSLEIAVEIVCRVGKSTYPIAAAVELAGAPMKSFTLGLTEIVVAQLAQDS
jgi:hypothetical protein